MKKNIYIIVLCILVFYILYNPQAAIQAASYGLVLWYTKMLPTLLPFAILSYIFVSSGLLDQVSKQIHKLIKKLIPISRAGIYPLFAGFLFGFPLGSKITAQLVEEGQLTKEEGDILFPVCNNISPVFISGFILTTSLKQPSLTSITLLLLYLPPLIYYVIAANLQFKKKRVPITSHKKQAPRSQINFKIIDAGIMSGFETLTKLGGYIMIFAIFSQISTELPIQHDILNHFIIGITEITNGVADISASSLPFESKYLLIIFCTSFGGLSGFAQTASMVRNAGLSMKNYLKVKLICSLVSLSLAACYLYL